MSYIENNLLPDEVVVYRAKPHWIMFAWSVVFLVLSLVFFATRGGVGGFGILFLMAAIFTGVGEFVRYSTLEFGITNRRVLGKAGLIRRHSIDMLLQKIESIQINQGLLGRALGYGTVTVIGTGGTREFFSMIDAPLEFRRKAHEEIEKSGK